MRASTLARRRQHTHTPSTWVGEPRASWRPRERKVYRPRNKRSSARPQVTGDLLRLRLRAL